MKIIVASFQCESNTRVGLHPGKSDFEYFAGEDIYKKLVVKDIFTGNGFETIPAIYANALPSATVEQQVYDFYKAQILDTIKKHPDAAGVYLYVHGSMEVDGIGSGELQLVKEIRQVVQKKCLIAFTMDLHANITEELSQYVDIICGYKTAPHTDQEECVRRAIAGAEKRIFITDSGDNTTAGAEGTSQELLRLLLEADPKKKTCVAGITDFALVDSLWQQPDGAQVWIEALGCSGIVKIHATQSLSNRESPIRSDGALVLFVLTGNRSSA